jgi:hypothetical protein
MQTRLSERGAMRVAVCGSAVCPARKTQDRVWFKVQMQDLWPLVVYRARAKLLLARYYLCAEKPLCMSVLHAHAY